MEPIDDGATVSGRRPRLADVAARSGVAVSTVSRALTDPERVNVVTRQRIQQVAAELGYRGRSPSSAARPSPAPVVAVLVPSTINSFSSDVIRGSQHELRSTGGHQLLIDTDGTADLEESLLLRAKDICTGAVLVTPRLADARIEALERATVPLVTVNRPRRTGGSVVLDFAAGVAQAVEHLVSLGHREIVYVSGPRESWSNERRWRSIARTTRRLGVRATRHGPHAPHAAVGTGAAEAVVNSLATGVIAFNDDIALTMLQRFAERGIDVPGDLSVVGCDDSFAGSCFRPGLTTVSGQIETAGRVAVSLLTGGKGHARSVVLPTHLVVRGSTGPAPGGVRRPA